MSNMKVSLIMPTINVTTELDLFLKSLTTQTYKNFELIVIDQNKDDRVLNIINEYEENFEIKYLKSPEKGLSLNRNKGLFVMDGDVVAFPDDDCEYQNDTIEKAVTFFSNNSNSDNSNEDTTKNENMRIYSCRTLERGKDYGTGIMLDHDAEITKDNVEETIKSITFFVNFKMEDIELFDENLGVGAAFGSGEETDYVLRLLHKGFKGQYFANDIIYHPAKKGNYDDLQRAHNYGLGYGALVKKEVVGRKNYMYIMKFIKKLMRNIGGMLITKHKKYHGAVFEARMQGYFKYKIEKGKKKK